MDDNPQTPHGGQLTVLITGAAGFIGAATAAVPHRLFNIGNSQHTPLLRFIEVLEQTLGKEAIKDFQPMQPGNFVSTAADTSALETWMGFQPNTPLEIGLERFTDWVKEHPELIGLT